MWRKGDITVNGEGFQYCMKQYEGGSEWGIEGGRISKLMIERDGELLFLLFGFLRAMISNKH